MKTQDKLGGAEPNKKSVSITGSFNGIPSFLIKKDISSLSMIPFPSASVFCRPTFVRIEEKQNQQINFP